MPPVQQCVKLGIDSKDKDTYYYSSHSFRTWHYWNEPQQQRDLNFSFFCSKVTFLVWRQFSPDTFGVPVSLFGLFSPSWNIIEIRQPTNYIFYKILSLHNWTCPALLPVWSKKCWSWLTGDMATREEEDSGSYLFLILAVLAQSPLSPQLQDPLSILTDSPSW